MIFDRCKNCKLYIPYQKDVKAILSKKTKIKYLDKGYCLYFYKTVKCDAWCEKHERKYLLKNERKKEMEIRKPKFELGQKVVDKNGNVETVISFNSYHFEDNEYWYDVSSDEGTHIKTESFLKPYIEKYETKKKTVWDLVEGKECYWLTLTGHIYNGIWDGSGLSIGIRDTGGCFLTREEAECEIERRKVETEMLRLGGRRKFNRGKDNYFIMYTRIEGLDYVNYHSMHEQGVIYFDSELDAINAVKTIGKDRIKKYIFGVNE